MKIKILIIAIISFFSISNLYSQKILADFANEDSQVHLSDIEFIGNIGIVIGYHGLCYYTIDKGETWTKKYLGTDISLYQIYILDSSNIWIYGDGGTIIKLNSVLQPYLDQSIDSKYEICKVQFLIKILVGLFPKAVVFFYTENGGANWEFKNFIDSASSIIDFIAVDKNIFYAAMETIEPWFIDTLKDKKGNIESIKTYRKDEHKEKILKSIDGGRTWNKLSQIENEENFKYSIYAKFKFAFSLWLGWACSRNNDEGKSWKWFDTKNKRGFLAN